MIVAYYIVGGLLALVALGSGLMKVIRPKAKLAEMGAPMAWTADFPDWQIKGIGALEILGAIGVILPIALLIAPVLGPLAALGLAGIHVAAFIVHVRRQEKPYVNMVIFALAGVTAGLGFLYLAGY